MFSTELEYSADCLTDLIKIIKIKNLKLDINQKIEYEKLYLVDW